MKQLLLLSLLIPTLAFAQGASGVGNGGSGVVCYQKAPNGTIIMSKAYSLDLWEARYETNTLAIDLGPANLTVFEKVQIFINRIRRLDPAFADDLGTRFESFKNSFEVQDRVRIKRIDDTQTVVDPKGKCRRFQIAVQKRVTDDFFDKKFQFDADVWKVMDRNERAALIFHELLYWTEIEHGADDSFGVRRIVGIFASKQSTELDLQRYLSLLKKWLIKPSYQYGKAQISLAKNDPLYFDSNGSLTQAKVIDQFPIQETDETTGDEMTYNTLSDKVYTFDGQKIIDGKLALASVVKNYPHHRIEFLIKRGIEIDGPTELTIGKLNDLSESVIVRLKNSASHYPLTPEQAKQSIAENGSIRFLPTEASVAEKLLEGFQIKIENAEPAGLLFSDNQTLTGIVVKTKGKGFLFDQASENGKHELSWKTSGLYEVTLDFNQRRVIKVQ